jgi:predicted permease
MLTDLRFALRRLASAPAFTAFSVVTLAVGVGVTTAMYSSIYSFSWKPLAIRDASEIVTVRQMGRSATELSGPEFAELRARQTALRDLSGYVPFTASLTGHERAELVSGEAVTGGFFQLLGIRPSLGRLIQFSDDRPEGPAVVVLSDFTWRRRFGSDPDIVGKAVKLSGRPFEVIGVTPAAFRGARGFGPNPQGLWVPLSLGPGRLWNARFDLTSPTVRQIVVIGRRAPGLTNADVFSQLGPTIQRFDALAPLTQSGVQYPRQVLVRPAFERPAGGDSTIAILGLPALILLIACTNLANLALSRGASRRHEFAVRRALGATRWQVVRGQLVEGVLVCGAGALAGALLSRWMLSWLLTQFQDAFGRRIQFDAIDPQLSLPVLGAVGVCALLAFLVSSLAPSLQLSRTGERASLATDTGAGASPKWRGRANMIAVQVSASVCLFLLTSLGVRVIVREDSTAVPLGIDRVAQIDMPFNAQQRSEADGRLIVDRFIDALRRRPGMESVAVAARYQGASVTTVDQPFIPGTRDGERVWVQAETPGALRLQGVKMISGRALDERDQPGAPLSIVLGRTAGEALFRGRNGIGQDVLVRLVDLSVLQYVTKTFRVVGICEDEDSRGGNPTVYISFAQEFVHDVSILARDTKLDVDGMATVLRTTLRDIDPDVAVTYAGRPNPQLWERGAVTRIWTVFAAILATLALALSMAGLYGVLSHVVSKRTRELGLRMALGADRRRIAQLIFKDGFRPIVEGLAIGLLVGFIFRMMLQPLFKNPLASFDPITLACAVIPLTIAGLAACYLPARRAAAVEPNVALRDL